MADETGRDLVEGAFYRVKTDFPGWSCDDRWVPALRLTPPPMGPKAGVGGWLLLGYPEPAWDDQAPGRGLGTNAFAVVKVGERIEMPGDVD